MTTSTAPHPHHCVGTLAHDAYLPDELNDIRDPQTDLPRIAKNQKLTGLIDSIIPRIPTVHDLHRADARRRLAEVASESVHLVLTSPPYWTLKEYPANENQLGLVRDYEKLHDEHSAGCRACGRETSASAQTRRNCSPRRPCCYLIVGQNKSRSRPASASGGQPWSCRTRPTPRCLGRRQTPCRRARACYAWAGSNRGKTSSA